MRDGVYPVQFCGEPAFQIIWRGKELAMLWGSEGEARRHLWLLNHPGVLDEIMSSSVRDAAATLDDLWDRRRACEIRARYGKDLAHG